MTSSPKGAHVSRNREQQQAAAIDRHCWVASVLPSKDQRGGAKLLPHQQPIASRLDGSREEGLSVVLDFTLATSSP